jgi:polyisoprenoid-binding protein YceI
MSTSRFLQYFGTLALAALVLGSAVALVTVKSRLQVVVSEAADAAPRGPDPLELLRADLAEVRSELGAAEAALPQHLQTLHDALDSGATDREATLKAELASLREQIASLSARLESTERNAAAARTQSQESLQRFATALNELGTAVAESTARAAELAQRPIEVVPVAVVPVEVAPVDVTPIEVASAQPAATQPTPGTPEPAKKGFLSFKVPEKGFRFDARQRLAVVASLSRVGFDAKSTLHDFSGVTQKVEGELTVDLSKPGERPKGRIAVDAASLDTGLADRDEGMRELLESEKQKQLTFEWNAFEPSSVDPATQTVAGTARGKLTLRGVSRDVAMAVKVGVDASKRVTIDGETRILLTDFGIEPPSQLGMIEVENELKLWISLRTRTLGLAEETK